MKKFFLKKTFNSFNSLERLFNNLSSNFFFQNKQVFFSKQTNKLSLTDLELSFSSNYFKKKFTNNTNKGFKTSVKFLNNKNKWSLSNRTLSSNKNLENSLKNLKGGFLSLNWSFLKYNNILVNKKNHYTITNSIDNQVNSLKTSKYLYHYSYLHRNILKNSHKLTMVKKLISSGFYDTKLTTNNLWASDLFNKINNPKTLLNNEVNLVYGNFFNNNFSKNYLVTNYQKNNNKNNLNFFNFFEKSYFFNLKRFYIFNNLGDTKIHISLIKKKKKPQ